MRALLAVALLFGFYLLCAALVLSYLGFVALAVARAGNGLSPLVWVAVAALGVGIAAMVRGVVLASGSRAVLPGSRSVSVREAPGLWALVREVADRFGTAAPVEVRLTAEPNAAVGEEARMLGLRTGRRRLYVGVPLLVGLTVDELRAVLCHEFGHYARGHTRLGALTYRGSTALGDTRRMLAETARGNSLVAAYGGVPVLVLNGYGRLYDRVSLAVRRRQEIDADAAAARIAGATTTAAALRSTHAVVAAWTRYRAGFAGRGDMFSPFRAVLEDPEYQDLMARHRARPRESVGTRDPHPALQRRLDLLARQPDVPPPATVEPPELLADSRTLFAELSARTTTAPPQLGHRGRTVSVLFSVGLLVLALLSLNRAGRDPAPVTPNPVITTELPAYPPQLTPQE